MPPDKPIPIGAILGTNRYFGLTAEERARLDPEFREDLLLLKACQRFMAGDVEAGKALLRQIEFSAKPPKPAYSDPLRLKKVFGPNR
jgi:hypothetical protein